MRSTTWQAIGWLGASCGLAGVIVLQLAGEPNRAPGVAAASLDAIDGTVPMHDALALLAPPAGLEDDIVARPLFAASRRPVMASSGKTLPALIGMLEVNGNKTLLLRDRQLGLHVLEQGETLAGWTIAEIEGLQVRVLGDGGSAWLDLRKHQPELSPVEDAEPTDARAGADDGDHGTDERGAQIDAMKAAIKMATFAREAKGSR